MGNCHFKPDFDAENFTGKLASNISQHSPNGIKTIPSHIDRLI